MATTRPTRRRRIRWAIALSVAAVWLGLWLAKDALFLSILRRQIKNVPDVTLSVGKAHLSFVPGYVELEDVEVVRPGDGKRNDFRASPLPLAHITRVQTRWKWRHLLRGAVTASAYVSGIEVTIWRVPPIGTGGSVKKIKTAEGELVPAPPEADTIVAVWPQISRFLVPVSIDEAQVDDARVVFRDVTVKPELRFPIEGICAHVENLTNRKALSDGRYASVHVEAKPAKGSFKLAMQVDPMARLPTFSMHASVKEVDVPSVNDVLLAYANFDAASGKVNAEIDVACEQGKFRGTLEPRILQFAVRAKAEKEEQNTFINRAYRTLLRAATSLVEDSKKETIATRVPLRGEFTDPNIGVAQAVLSLLGNAWWQSLSPAQSIPEGALPELRGSMGRQGQSAKPSKPAKASTKKPQKPGIKPRDAK